MIKDYFRISFSAFKSRKLRTGLTLLGVFIGIALLITLMSLGSGLQKFITDQFEQMGSDKLMIMPGSSMFGAPVEGIELTKKDLEIIERTQGIEAVTGAVIKIGAVTYKEETTYTWTLGTPMDTKSWAIFESMSSAFKVEKGRKITDKDTSKVNIGIDVATDKKLFDKGVSLGDKIIIEGKEFEVVGIYGRIGNPQDDSQIYLPIDVARDLFDEPDKYDMIVAQSKTGEDPENVAEKVKKNLRKSRDVKEDEEDFTIQTSEQLLESFGTILAVIQAVLIGLATISLLVGGIGIANTMYTSILERTREIGVMKAIGAKTTDIASLFIIESGLIGLGAGLIGVTIGALISLGIQSAIHLAGYTMLNVNLSLSLLLGGLAFAFVFGIVSGLIPAIKASKMNPVDSLRYE
ncbi:MAG: ABC transporter permease [Nanoarchaeota archaeon]|nr:ABC transporter permease [Nanoarchaeota archaeon]MBU4352127.1 ABC transporter permease [Nanoarchaeota archaeon]MBU4455887.1 ABC transporter permease [Nanoarchaeota archaeon]MCG2720224.1 ABC transporter permease [Nanoarchaeota archaeon]